MAGDGKIYIAADAGYVIVLKAGPRFEVLAENEIGEAIGATPVAAVKRRLNVRSASFDRRIICSTGFATEKCSPSQFWAISVPP